ncbi:MAG TPA: AI-2E family transporter [Puia sp.]|nr:AI-2E family transporter [Puia sp.]
MPLPLNKLPFYQKLASVLVSLIAIGYLVILGKEILSPLIFSCLFSILLIPLASFMERRFGFRRGLASILAILILVTFISSIIYFVGMQISNLADDWPQFKIQLNSSLASIQHWIAFKFHINSYKQLTFLKSAASKALDSGTTVLGTTIISLSSFILFLIFTFIYTLFLLTFRRLIMNFLISVFLEENSTVVHDIVEKVQQILRKYIIGLFIEMCVVSVVVFIAFWSFGIKYAALLAIITGLLNIIPYIGIFSAMLISFLITFATAAATGKLFLVVITLVITHLVDSNILLPGIVGSKVKINPLITVLGVVLGEMIWGVSGMFLSIPVIAVLKIIFDRVESLKPWGVLLGEEGKTTHLKTIQPKVELDSTVVIKSDT